MCHRRFREFGLACVPIGYHKPNFDNDGVYLIENCPKCGTRFLPGLRARWYEEILDKFGVEDIYDQKQKEKIPNEYFSDLWWKNDPSKNVMPNKRTETTSKLCCPQMDGFFDMDSSRCLSLEDQSCTDLPLTYSVEKRRFFIASTNSSYLKHKIYNQQERVVRNLKYDVHFCLWCGFRLL